MSFVLNAKVSHEPVCPASSIPMSFLLSLRVLSWLRGELYLHNANAWKLVYSVLVQLHANLGA